MHIGLKQLRVQRPSGGAAPRAGRRPAFGGTLFAGLAVLALAAGSFSSASAASTGDPAGPSTTGATGAAKGGAPLPREAAASAGPAMPDPSTSGNLNLVGRSDLGGQGLNADVAVVGNTVVVGTGDNPGSGFHTNMYNPYPCPEGQVKLVDISRPVTPQVVGRIPVPAGVSALDVDAIHVTTPSFSGDLAAIALSICGGDHASTGGGALVNRGVAYYDVTHPAAPRFLGRYFADKEFFPKGKKCGLPPPNNLDPGACASSQHSVSLRQRSDGRVISASTEPFSGNDLRVVDVTDPTHPTEIATFPPVQSKLQDGISDNGCRPFAAGHSVTLYDQATKALLPYLDAGLADVGLSNPAHPTLSALIDPYPANGIQARKTEGNGAYAAPAGPNDNLALLSDEDWIAPNTYLRVDSPATSTAGLTTGLHFGCEAMFTLFDPQNTAQIFRNPGSQVPPGPGRSSDLVYVGRGCPVNQDFGTTKPDPYIKDANGNPVSVKGKIAVMDRFEVDQQSNQGLVGFGCLFDQKARRAQANGAIAVVMLDAAFGGPAFSPDGDPSGIDIPLITVDDPTSEQLRNTLCPRTNPDGSGICVGGTNVRGALVDQPGGSANSPGGWGGLRVIDQASHAQVGQYKTPRAKAFPPQDLGVYSVHHAVADGNEAFVAWNSDGLRVLDLSNPSNPSEVGRFVPPDVPDPSPTGLPSKTYVVGVALAPHCNVVISDINFGIYVVAAPAGSAARRTC